MPYILSLAPKWLQKSPAPYRLPESSTRLSNWKLRPQLTGVRRFVVEVDAENSDGTWIVSGDPGGRRRTAALIYSYLYTYSTDPIKVKPHKTTPKPWSHCGVGESLQDVNREREHVGVCKCSFGSSINRNSVTSLVMFNATPPPIWFGLGQNMIVILETRPQAETHELHTDDGGFTFNPPVSDP